MERMKRERAASTENKARLKNSDTLCSGDISICLPRAMVGNCLPLHDSGVRVTIPDNQVETTPRRVVTTPEWSIAEAEWRNKNR